MDFFDHLTPIQWFSEFEFQHTDLVHHVRQLLAAIDAPQVIRFLERGRNHVQNKLELCKLIEAVPDSGDRGVEMCKYFLGLEEPDDPGQVSHRIFVVKTIDAEQNVQIDIQVRVLVNQTIIEGIDPVRRPIFHGFFFLYLHKRKHHAIFDGPDIGVGSILGIIRSSDVAQDDIIIGRALNEVEMGIQFIRQNS